MFYYYMFKLNKKEYYYYTSIPELDENEIIEHAARYGLIEEKDIPNCKNVREISLDEVKEIERELYQEWWAERERKIANGEFVGLPPHIGVQLD